MKEPTDTERLGWLLEYLGIDHEGKRSFLTWDGPWLPDGVKWFEEWEEAQIEQDNPSAVLCRAIDAAILAEREKER